MQEGKYLYEFGAFRLDPAERLLLRDGSPVTLFPKAFDTLAVLVENGGHLISKDELIKRVWPDTFVEEVNLARNISAIRRALGEAQGGEQYIETVPKSGYRFVREARRIFAEPPTPTVQRQPAFTPGEISPKPHKQSIRRTIIAGAIVVLLLAAIFVAAARFFLFAPASGATQIRSIAVLPLANLSSDPDQEYFCDGMTDALITELAQISSLKVISRTSSIQYRHTKKPLPEIARELGVDGVVEGTVQQSADRVRITAQLIEAPKDRHLWAKAYETDVRNVLSLEGEIARSIAREVEVHLTPAQRSRLETPPTVSREAYDLYLRGRYFWNKRDAQGLTKALDYFQRVAEIEPDYGPAQAGLADTYSLLGAAGYDVLPRAEAMEKARAAASRAIAIDEGLAEAHASLGFVIYSYDWNWSAAEKEFRRAIALNSNYAAAHEFYSQYLNDLGRKEEALAQAQTALSLDPVSVVANNYVARTHYFARRINQCIETSKKILEMDPNFAVAHLRLGRAYAANGQYHEAIREFETFGRLTGDTPLATASIGNALAQSGDRSRALHALHELRSISRTKRVPPICFALVYAGLGDNNQTIAWLEEAYNERSDFLLVLKVDPLFDRLRPEPRFQELLHRLNLPVDSASAGFDPTFDPLRSNPTSRIYFAE